MNPVHIGTHVDPFAPADHPDHPANAGRAPRVDSEVQPEPLNFSAEEFADLLVTFADDLVPDLEHNEMAERLIGDLIDERNALFGAYGTPDEHQDEFPALAELRARRRAHVEELNAARPRRDDPKAKWVEHYRRVFPQATEEEAGALTLPELRDLTLLDDQA